MPRKRTVRKRIARARVTRRKSGGDYERDYIGEKEAASRARQAQENEQRRKNEQKKKNANAQKTNTAIGQQRLNTSQNDAARNKMKDELRNLEKELAQISMIDLEKSKQKLKERKSMYESYITRVMDMIKDDPIRDFYQDLLELKIQDETFLTKRRQRNIKTPELEGLRKLLSDMKEWPPMKRSWFGPSDAQLASMKDKDTKRSIEYKYNEFIKNFKLIADCDTNISEIDEKILYAQEISERIKELKTKLGLL